MKWWIRVEQLPVLTERQNKLYEELYKIWDKVKDKVVPILEELEVTENDIKILKARLAARFIRNKKTDEYRDGVRTAEVKVRKNER